MDSAAGEPCRFSVLGFDPLSFENSVSEPVHPIDAIAELTARLSSEPGDVVPGPFQGGFIGAISYDAGVRGEELGLRAEPWGQPLFLGGLYTDFLVWDHVADAAWLVLGEEPGDARPIVEEREAAILASLSASPSPQPFSAAGQLERHQRGERRNGGSKAHIECKRRPSELPRRRGRTRSRRR